MRLRVPPGAPTLAVALVLASAAPLAGQPGPAEGRAGDLHPTGAAVAGGTTPVWVERTRPAMGTRLRIRAAAADRAAAIRAGEAAFRAVARVEDLLSTWRPDTELSALNAADIGRPRKVAAPLLALLGEAFAWSERTGGAFDPAIGSLVQAWDLRGEGRRPGPGELARALRSAGTRCFSLPEPPTSPAGGRETAPPATASPATTREASAVTRRCSGAWIDAGGFGKGAALREAAETLRARGAAAGILDFGGQLLAVGPLTAPVAVAHPSRRGEAIARLELREASAATTGVSERGVWVAGRRIGHVLDPRTGRPVPAWGSVTVVHRDPVAADVLSTALFVLGPEAGRDLADRLRVAALFLVEEAGDRLAACGSREMQGHRVELADGVSPGCGARGGGPEADPTPDSGPDASGPDVREGRRDAGTREADTFETEAEIEATRRPEGSGNGRESRYSSG